MSGPIWVLVYAVAPAGEPDAVLTAYHAISKELDGTPGLLGNRLLQATDGTGRFVVMSEWRDAEAFRTWERGASHRDTTSPLRPYQDRGRETSFGIYELVASY